MPSSSFYKGPIESEITESNNARSRSDYAFRLYNAKAEQEDQDFWMDCNDAMDSLLVFAGLFSAVTTALIVESYKDLRADPSVRTQQLLEAIFEKTEAASPNVAPSPAAFSPSTSAVVTNTLFFLSLSVSLLAGLGAILIKQWARSFYIRLHHIASPHRRARLRFQRVKGIRDYRFSLIVAWIPMMLHISLFFFFAGLVLWLRSINLVIFIATLILCGSSLAIYISGAVLGSLDENSPFDWPAASLIRLTPLHRLGTMRRGTVHAAAPFDLNRNPAAKPVTPVDQVELPDHDVLTQSPKRLDIDILLEVLQNADTNVEVEAALDQLRRILSTPNTLNEEITSEEITSFVNKAANLALSCGAHHIERADIVPSTAIQRIMTIMQFFEALLQTVVVNLKDCEQAFRTIIPIIRIFHRRMLESKALIDISLSASCLARMEALIGYKSEIGRLVEDAPSVMEELNQLGPSPAGKPRPKGWSTDEVHRYQTLVAAYLASFIELLGACDRIQIKLEKKTLDAILIDGRILIDNSRNATLATTTGDHPLLLQVLKDKWQSFLGPDDQLATTIMKHFLSILGHDASIENGIHVVRKR